MHLDARRRVYPVMGRREPRWERMSLPAAAPVWTRLSSFLLLSASAPAWALDGRCDSPRSFWGSLPFVLPISAVSGMIAATAAALLGFLLQSIAQKLLRREFSHRRCVQIPTLTIGVGTFAVIFLGGFALMTAFC